MQEDRANNALASTSVEELLRRIGMLTPDGEPHRSNPLLDPAAFRELVSQLAGIVDRPYDLIVVRDLFGDRVLGYQLCLITGKPVVVSYDREGLIVLEDRDSIERGSTVLIAADTHFTDESIRAAASGIERAGVKVAGVAMLLQLLREEYPFPVWALKRLA
jgi:hypothetical protein